MNENIFKIRNSENWMFDDVREILTSFYRLGQKCKNIFVRFLIQMKTLKFAFEINWPLIITRCAFIYFQEKSCFRKIAGNNWRTENNETSRNIGNHRFEQGNLPCKLLTGCFTKNEFFNKWDFFSGSTSISLNHNW